MILLLSQVFPTLLPAVSSDKMRRHIFGLVPHCPGTSVSQTKISWTICRIVVWPFVDIVKAGQPGRPKTGTGEVMRKINVLEFVSLDGVIQAPGEPEEDTVASHRRR